MCVQPRCLSISETMTKPLLKCNENVNNQFNLQLNIQLCVVFLGLFDTEAVRMSFHHAAICESIYSFNAEIWFWSQYV